MGLTQSAAAFFKSIKEESSIEEVLGTLGKAYKWEFPVKARASDEDDQLEKSIEGKLGSKWTEVRRRLAQDYGQMHILRREALILLYSRLLRLETQDAALQKRASLSCEVLITHRTD
jgi:translocation protein SEC63